MKKMMHMTKAKDKRELMVPTGRVVLFFWPSVKTYDLSAL